MSRSRRLPYYPPQIDSTPQDKRTARRIVRRVHERCLRRALRLWAFDDFILAHKFECRHNERWDWARDGKQCRMPTPFWPHHGGGYGSCEEALFWSRDYFLWYERIQRK